MLKQNGSYTIFQMKISPWSQVCDLQNKSGGKLRIPGAASHGFCSNQAGVFGKVNGNPLQCSCLGNPMARGAWRATVHGVTELDTTERLDDRQRFQIQVPTRPLNVDRARSCTDTGAGLPFLYFFPRETGI